MLAGRDENTFVHRPIRFKHLLAATRDRKISSIFNENRYRVVCSVPTATSGGNTTLEQIGLLSRATCLGPPLVTVTACGCIRKGIRHKTSLHNTYDESPLGFITGRQTTTRPDLGKMSPKRSCMCV